MAILRTPDPGVGSVIADGALGFGGSIGGIADTVATGVSTVAAGATAAVPGLGDVTDGARAVRRWVSDRHNWVRVAWFAAGAAMFTAGVVMLGQRPVTAAVGTVAKPVASIVGKVKP